MRDLLVIAGTDGAALGRAGEILARDRRVVAGEAEIGEKADVLARRDGCVAALQLAVRQPGRIGALVLESPPDPAADTEIAALLPRLALPVLVLYGTGDRVTQPDLGRRYKAALPNAWFVMVYNAGHDIAADRPEAFADLVGDFLRRGARFTVSDQSTRINP